MSSGLQRVPSRPTCRSSNRRAFTWGSISRRRLHLAFLYRMCSSLGPTRCANDAPRVHHAARQRGSRLAARDARAGGNFDNSPRGISSATRFRTRWRRTGSANAVLQQNTSLFDHLVGAQGMTASVSSRPSPPPAGRRKRSSIPRADPRRASERREQDAERPQDRANRSNSGKVRFAQQNYICLAGVRRAAQRERSARTRPKP